MGRQFRSILGERSGLKERFVRSLVTQTYRPIITAAGTSHGHRLPGWYHAVMIIISCTACILPMEMFLFEIWPLHGFFSLLFFLLPLIGGSLLALCLPQQYYRTKYFEASGHVYERLGIRFFKRIVSDGDYINRFTRRSDPGYRVVSNKGSLLRFEAGTRWAECLHLAWLVVTLPSIVYALILDWNWFALWLFLPNILLHLYLVLLQRYTRARIHRVLRQRKSKS